METETVVQLDREPHNADWLKRRRVRTLKQHRTARGLSLRGLAASAGVTVQTVLYAEQGTRRPQLRTCGRISRALGVRPENVAEFRAVVEEEWL